MSNLSERTNPERTNPERTHGLAARVVDRPRELQEVALFMLDGTEVRGMLHRAHASRTLDFLNRQTEGFVAMTDVMVFHGERVERMKFIAVNKAHVLRVIEAADAD
jgi:hypothetical protein